MKGSSNIYTAFGLIFDSEMELPELIPAAGQADVKIVWGKVPDHLESPIEKTPWLETAAGQYLLRVDGIAGYYAANGNCIIIEPCHEVKHQDVRVFLLNTVLAALLHQRDYLVLHGSAAVVDGKAAAFVGISQAGKTAIALSLYDRGYLLLSDEISAIQVQDGKAILYPGIPQLNAWRDTLKRAGKNVDAYQPIRNGINKYAFPVYDQFGQTGYELGNIVFLQHHNQKKMYKQVIQGGARLKKLIEHACFINTVTDKARHFHICAAIVKQTALFELTFNELTDPVNQITDMILKELN